jgi:hypothetical protein
MPTRSVAREAANYAKLRSKAKETYSRAAKNAAQKGKWNSLKRTLNRSTRKLKISKIDTALNIIDKLTKKINAMNLTHPVQNKSRKRHGCKGANCTIMG